MKEKIFNTKLLIIINMVLMVCNFILYSESLVNIDKYPNFWLFNVITSAYFMVIFGVRLELLRSEQRRNNK